MSWSREEFLAILNTDIAKHILKNEEVDKYAGHWTDDNKAALLHANGVTEQSDAHLALSQLQLIAAFARKDVARVRQLAHDENVSVGVRLDYLLPLFDQEKQAGEDVFVAATKVMLLGNAEQNITLANGQMVHKVGSDINMPYSAPELAELEDYVNSAFDISKILSTAPNKATIQPNTQALDYILHHASTYRDSNQNPVIVFIPGAISIQGRDISGLIDEAILNGANVNDVGFFGVPGIVWSIILGDLTAVNTLLGHQSRVDIIDEMGNHNVAAWAAATFMAVEESNQRYRSNLLDIMQLLYKPNCEANFSNHTPIEYLDWYGNKEFSKRQNENDAGTLARQASYFQRSTSPIPANSNNTKISERLRTLKQ